MARTPLSPSLVHDRAAVMRDARRLDTLSLSIAPALEPFAADALARITAETLAEDVTGSAAEVLAPMLREPALLAPATERVHESLSDALAHALPAADAELVHARAIELSQFTLASWFATLHDALATTRHLSLLDGIYASESSRDHLHALLHEQGVRDGARCFRAIRDALLTSEAPVELPGDMRLELVGHTGGQPEVSATHSREFDDGASPALAESGTRRRDGHQEEEADDGKKSSA